MSEDHARQLARQRLSQKALTRRQKAAQEAFVRRFAAFVRGCDYQLNVQHRWPCTVDWT
jgi:hypothetical protein